MPPTVEQNAELDAAAKALGAAQTAAAAAQDRLNRAIAPYVGNEAIKPGRYVLVAGSPIHLIVKDGNTAAVEETPLLADSLKAV